MKNIFVVGYEDHNVEHLKQLGCRFKFYCVLSFAELKKENLPISELYEKAKENIATCGIKPDAIITYWDFPATLLTAMLNAYYKLPGPSLDSIIRCEHKLLSRELQANIIPEHIPRFVGLNPFDDNVFNNNNLSFPFWIKPVKSYRSFLAFKIDNRQAFEEAIQKIRKQIMGIYKPFIKVLEDSNFTTDIPLNPSLSCIAEEVLTGEMCTLEGFVFNREVTSYEIVDSLLYKDHPSFFAFQLPSSLPLDIQERMKVIAKKVVTGLKLNNTCFNIEFFYNKEEDKISLLEVNPRTSQSHSELFARAYGTSQLQYLVSIALGQRPKLLKKKKEHCHAGNFLHRHFNQSDIIKKVPSPSDLNRISTQFKNAKIYLHVSPGQNFSDLKFQDSYSILLTTIYLDAPNKDKLSEDYQTIIKELKFDFIKKEKND